MSPAPFDGKGGRGEGKPSERSDTLTFEEIYVSKRFTFGGGVGEPDQAEQFARMLAERLGDPGSIAGFRRLAETHPEPLLGEALRRTLLIPCDRITKSRGACFVGIVRKLVATGWSLPSSTLT